MRAMVRMTGVMAAMCMALAADASAQVSHSTVHAKDFAGADLGAKINAADAALGTTPGEILVDGGGAISTTVVVSSNHTLRFLPGTYTTSVAPAILLKNHSVLEGSGWNTVIVESTDPGEFLVVAPYVPGTTSGALGDAENVTIRNLQIKGASNRPCGTGANCGSATPAVLLGNCRRCAVDRVWVNQTHSIGIVVGGNSDAQQDFHADTSSVTNCLLTGVASQGIAVINGRNVSIRGNILRDMGLPNGPGVTAIDVEPNSSYDVIENIAIVDNTIDYRGASVLGNGIVFQSGGTTRNGPGLIANNMIMGGDISPDTVSNKLSNAIFVIGVRDVAVMNNVIRRTGQCGIYLLGATRTKVSNNLMEDVGGGGIEGMRVADTTSSRIYQNVMTYSGSGTSWHVIVESGTSNGNIFLHNDVGVTKVGSTTKVIPIP